MLAGYLFFDIGDRERSERPLFFLFLSTSLLLMTARWKRFAEYFPPFAILFAAFTLENFWRGRAVFTRLPEHVLEDLQPFLDRDTAAPSKKAAKEQETWQYIKVAFFAIALGAALFANVYRTAKDIRET